MAACLYHLNLDHKYTTEIWMFIFYCFDKCLHMNEACVTIFTFSVGMDDTQQEIFPMPRPRCSRCFPWVQSEQLEWWMEVCKSWSPVAQIFVIYISLVIYNLLHSLDTKLIIGCILINSYFSNPEIIFSQSSKLSIPKSLVRVKTYLCYGIVTVERDSKHNL